jgi:hypothetical protein
MIWSTHELSYLLMIAYHLQLFVYTYTSLKQVKPRHTAGVYGSA